MKCDQYWPGRGTETYGLIQVTLLDTVELATYTVRTFALYKVKEEGKCGLPRSCKGAQEVSFPESYMKVQGVILTLSQMLEVREPSIKYRLKWKSHLHTFHSQPSLALFCQGAYSLCILALQ